MNWIRFLYIVPGYMALALAACASNTRCHDQATRGLCRDGGLQDLPSTGCTLARSRVQETCQEGSCARFESLSWLGDCLPSMSGNSEPVQLDLVNQRILQGEKDFRAYHTK
jgi:hypothetical protein